MTPARTFALMVAASGALAGLVSCGSITVGGSKGVSTVNDELRRKVASLETENARLIAQRDELTAKLAESERSRTSALPEDVLAAIPRCAGVEIGSLSGPMPEANGQMPGFVAYIEPFDGRRRFVQIVGTLRVEAVLLPPQTSENPASQAAAPEPRVLARATLTPAQLREAYRSGLTGTHYTVDLPITGPAGPASAIDLRGASVLFRATFEDALTGRVHEADRTRSPR
jgi:hypothetical protein